MKKRLVILTWITLVVLTACDREPCSLCTDEMQARHISLGLSGIPVSVKAADVTEGQESAVNNCTLYIFDRDGRMVNSFVSDSGTFDFYLTDATYDFVAVVNKGQLPASGISRKELENLPTLLSENSVGNFVMVGTLDGHLIQADEKLTVEVRRAVAKVSYKIRTAFVGTLAAKPFSIEELYLTNVAGSTTLGFDSHPGTSGKWYNKMNLEAAGGDMPESLLYGRVGRSLGPLDSIWTGHTLYMYPNESPDDHETGNWSARSTRFVVKASLDGKTSYYPVTIPSATNNKHYHIDMTISNFGVDHPEVVPGGSDYVEVYVTVADWEDGGVIHGNY